MRIKVNSLLSYHPQGTIYDEFKVSFIYCQTDSLSIAYDKNLGDQVYVFTTDGEKVYTLKEHTCPLDFTLYAYNEIKDVWVKWEDDVTNVVKAFVKSFTRDTSTTPAKLKMTMNNLAGGTDKKALTGDVELGP